MRSFSPERHGTQPSDPHRSGVLLVSLGAVRDDGPSQQSSSMPDLARALLAVLPQGWQVFSAAVLGQPSVLTVLKEIESAGIDDLTVVPLHPQFSLGTSGVVLRELYRSLYQTGLSVSLTTRASWHDDVGYVNAQARMLAEFATSQLLLPNDAYLVFWAHSPASSNNGATDTYTKQVKQTADLVVDRLGWPTDRYAVYFGSRLHTEDAEQPGTPQEFEQLFAAGIRQVLLCNITSPVEYGDVSEHVSALHGEISCESRCQVFVCPALNRYGPFVAALKNLVLQGARPVMSGQVVPKPLLQALAEPEMVDADPKSLVMIGASLSNGLVPRFGPRLRYSEAAAFASVRKSRKELFEFLEWVKEDKAVAEAFVWDTCQRIEFYGWMQDPSDIAGRECLIARIRHRLYGTEPDNLKVNVLSGTDAWHHLMRTASGLNSALPGDTDVAEQLRTALRIAQRTNTAGAMASCLVNKAVEVSQRVRNETAWGRFSSGYCFAAMSRLHELGGLRFDECRHVVIGGSTTSRSVVAALAEHFGVPRRQMTLVYRCNHGQMKLLRAAIGSGKRLRVNSYSEAVVVQEIADADFVYFGIDHPEPVLGAGVLCGLRDYAVRPLQIVDFNSFGSLSNLEPIDGVSVWTAGHLDQAVTAHAEILRARSRFTEALDQAEEWILTQVSAARSAHGGPRGGEVSAGSAAI
ncbi:MAG: ferrochelatase [Gemmatimonadota bacterium]|nr:MAG: ferrochelatase [Gemmatimonadota bacterium]